MSSFKTLEHATFYIFYANDKNIDIAFFPCINEFDDVSYKHETCIIHTYIIQHNTKTHNPG